MPVTIRRRELIAALVGTAVWPLAVRAQQAHSPITSAHRVPGRQRLEQRGSELMTGDRRRDQGGNDAHTSWDWRRRARIECNRLGANRDGVLERSRRACCG